MISTLIKTPFFWTLLIVFLLLGCSAHTTDKNQLTLMDNEGFVIDNHYLSNGMLLVSNGKDGEEKRFGFINTDGELTIPLEYRAFLPFNEDLVFAMKDMEKRGYIDKTGTEVITKIEGKAITLGDIFIDGYASVKLEGEKGSYVIDKSGEVYLTPTEKGYHYRTLHGGLFERYDTSLATDPKGVVDIHGQVKYSGDMILIASTDNWFYTDDQYYGIFDNQNYTTLTEPRFINITKFVNSIAVVAEKDGTVKMIDPNGDVVVDLSRQYPNIDAEKLYEFSDGVTVLNFTDDTSPIIIDLNGEAVAKTDCDELKWFHDGITVCENDGKYGYIDSEGTEILEPIYEVATNIDGGIGFVSKEGSLYRFSAH